MAITIPPCGSHCGITGPREGHCDCELCHDGMAPIVITRGDLLTIVPRQPMCGRWYERAGEYRPWMTGSDPGCRCGVSPHALPYQHGGHCPVRQDYDRKRLGDPDGGWCP